MHLKVKKLDPAAILPQYATAGAACFDIHALAPWGSPDWDNMEERRVHDFNPLTLRTGLAFEIPEGHVMLVFSRSGHGFKNDVRLANCTGVIDSDFRGELMVKLTCDQDTVPVLIVRPGDRIAQAMIVPIPRVEMVEVDELGTTERGAGGLGSTGA